MVAGWTRRFALEYSIEGYPDKLRAHRVTIPADSSQSDIDQTQGLAVLAVILPAEWTPARLSFRAGAHRNAMFPVYDNSGNLLTAAVAASRYVTFPLDSPVFGPFFSLVSVDAAGQPAPQAAARDIILLCRDFLS